MVSIKKYYVMIHTILVIVGCLLTGVSESLLAGSSPVNTLDNGPIVETLMIASQEGADSKCSIARRGILVTNKNAKATILICHGFMCDKYDVGFLRTIFSPGQFNFLTFDFRAHGDDIEGQCCTFGKDEAFDVMAAGRYLRSLPSLKDKPLFAFGFSMGAVAAIEAQAQDPSLFDAMILDCPFDSSENVLKTTINCLKFSIAGYEVPMPGRSLLHRYAFHPHVQSFIKILLKTVSGMETKCVQAYMCPLSPGESVKKISVPCFFIHCKKDEKISIDAIKSVYEGAAGYKSLWITNGRRHFDSYFYNPELYSTRVTAFLNGVMDGTIATQAQTGGIIEDDDDLVVEKK